MTEVQIKPYMGSPEHALLERVLDHITSHPEMWDQNSWVDVSSEALDAADPSSYTDPRVLQETMCGTTACLAGWSMLLSDDYAPVVELRTSVNNVPFSIITGIYELSTGQTIPQIAEDNDDNLVYQSRAADLLGVTPDQATYLFYDLMCAPDNPRLFSDMVRVYLGLPARYSDRVSPCPQLVNEKCPLNVGDTTSLTMAQLNTSCDGALHVAYR